jgi:ferric-dicitrate binding protein FerR (iron transport regulator)
MKPKYYRGLSDNEKKEVKDNIYQNLGLDVPGKRTFIAWKNSWSIGIAASIAAVTIGLLLYQMIPVKKNNDTVLLARTGNNEIKKILLPDSSTVILNANSSLHYNKEHHPGSREVYLEGNGFFKVKKTPSGDPFIVHAFSHSITVLGTEFNVNARTPALEVALTSGKVKVNENGNEQNAQFMNPGEKLQLDPINGNFNRSVIDTSLYSAWTTEEWNFRQTSLEDIAALITEYYGVQVVFKTEDVKKLRMTAIMPVSNLKSLVPVIAETLLINITEANNQLYVH